MPSPTRNQFEHRLGHSLAAIRIHADQDAATRARRRGAVAFTTGRDIYFGPGAYQPQTPVGDWIIGHELTHAVQQRLAEVSESNLPTATDSAHENQANTVAAGRSVPVRGTHPPAAMALTPAQFKSQLGTTPEQALAINTLFSDASFSALWKWFGSCTAKPKKDLGPLALRVTRGLRIGGVVRFGGYSPFSSTLEINPTKAEHVANPAEMVDTIFHELIHAADDLNAKCQAAGSSAAPLAGGKTSTLPPRASVAGTPTEKQFNIKQGPGASNPCGEFLDINAAAQTLVTNAIQANIKISGIGQPTLTFVNMIIRHNPTALASYETCRKSACKLSGSKRTKALGKCSRETISKFLPASMQSALLPAQLRFDSNASKLKTNQLDKLELIARYLVYHPKQTVELVGHTDAGGLRAYNKKLGLKRANSVRAELLKRGVKASQIRKTRSEGQSSPISSSKSERWRDRRVEIRL